jgi:chitinase
MGEITPRNMVWVEDMPPAFTPDDCKLLTESYYTHAIVCSFHLDPGPKLVYNGANDPYDPKYAGWWNYLRSLRQANLAKTLMMSVGGWGSGTWKCAQGQEAQGAAQIVKFAQSQGFAGIDFNFEGDYREHTDEFLQTFGKLVVEVRKIWNGILTITPIYGQVAGQLQHIRNPVGHDFPWGDYLSWVNVQFYTYQDGAPDPMGNVLHLYDLVLSTNGLQANMVTAGFPLSETDLQFNQNELQTATGAVKNILSAHPDFAGMFVWRFRGAFLGDRTGHPLDWAYHFSQILHNR